MSVFLTQTEEGQYRQRITIDRHTLFADARVDHIDSDSAPNPHDLYDASLAACKAITLMMYAERANIPLEGIDVGIVRDSSEEASGTYRLQVELELKGALEESQRSRLEKVAEKCPLHKLMTSVTTVITSSCKLAE
ncbi:MAG: OsmC family protein [Marinobacter sp.]|uniref:OsmC family protein n=1 Tax=Marinobacter sp. TaxID=50741 RepID=UPI00299E5A4F|nr:OsmC family protein [Marinobacter sp.]MDX1755100.1 OsmC family protein [Marinobacter sp.]